MGEKGPDVSENDQSSGRERVKINTFSYLKILVSLLLVLAVIYAIFYVLKKQLRIQNSYGQESLMLASHALGPGKWIQVIYIGGKYLVLGVTNDHINLLTEVTDPKEIEALEILQNTGKAERGDPFARILNSIFKRGESHDEANKEFNYEVDSVDFLQKQKNRFDEMKGE